MFSLFKKAKNEIKEIIDNMNLYTCCFTGHRSQKLPWKFNEADNRYKLTRHKVKMEIINAINRGYRYFITGMALGFDMMCAEIVLELKKTFKDIKLECAVPCKGQELKWSEKEQKRYKSILKQADKIRCIYDNYVDGCMKERNQYMVNNSSLLIALFNGLPGGTKQTIDYAKSQGLEIIVVGPVKEVLSDEELNEIIKENK